MARPKSEDKHKAILAAAVELIAEQGVSAPTARIAKLAGIAEGSLFTYFPSKDELLNQLYLSLKSELREAMMNRYPRKESTKNRLHYAWQVYVEWGVANPEKRKVMALLGMSERVSKESKAAGMEAFADINALLHEKGSEGAMRGHPPAFAAAIMGTLAETTMDFMAREPKQAQRYSEHGFDAFWNAIAKK